MSSDSRRKLEIFQSYFALSSAAKLVSQHCSGGLKPKLGKEIGREIQGPLNLVKIQAPDRDRSIVSNLIPKLCDLEKVFHLLFLSKVIYKMEIKIETNPQFK